MTGLGDIIPGIQFILSSSPSLTSRKRWDTADHFLSPFRPSLVPSTVKPIMTSAEASAPRSALVEASSPPSTCFTCTQLNPTTFLIVENDQWGEMPFIYAKIYASVVVLIDTGCGGAARDPSVQLRSLQKFLETYPVQDNGGRPLNPDGGKGYAVVCTHCHYDHIGEQNLCLRSILVCTQSQGQLIADSEHVKAG